MAALKLNLGCGPKRIDGYTGVDANGETAGCDVQADIRDLPYQTGTVDEILAVHIIEHFYVWEVPSLLQEWRRVMKPGGLLVLEQPCLRKTVLGYLQEPGKAQYIHGIYGSPGGRNELMCHHWGWTADTLSRELRLAGFRDIMPKPAVYHIPARDFRMEAIK